MAHRRQIVIALDGFEPSLAAEMQGQGLMPAFAALRARSAVFDLDHGGEAKRTGLAAEHFSTGLAPQDSGRWAAVDFDRRTYEVSQEPTGRPPFPAALQARTVVFDPAYFDLAQAPDVRGMVSWGAHDPGVPRTARPASLDAEIVQRFGPYPADEWIYGFVWQSEARTRAMGRDLVKAVDLRADVASWLLKDRMPDWDLAILMISEAHSAIEALWHGIDPHHPLADLPSARPAGEGVRGVYQAIDRMVGRLAADHPDAGILLFSMHGMGSNDSDPPSMLLLPELLHRRAYGRPYLREGAWTAAAGGPPLLAEHDDWHEAMHALVPDPTTRVQRLVDRLRRKPYNSLSWMPAARYQRFWSRMPFFALPSFYDGRVRINLKGREARGQVPREGYDAACDEVETLLRDCRDPITGDPVIASIDRTGGPDPLTLGPSEADLVVIWRGAPLGLVHPALGTIGPVPYRRTGGHTGRYGMAMIQGDGFDPGFHGVRSAFDVVPTICDLMGETPATPLTGRSLRPVRAADAA